MLSDGNIKEYPFYRCNQHCASHSCDRKRNYSEHGLEEYLLSHIRPALSEYIAEYEVSGCSPAQKNPAAEAAKIQKKFKKLYDLFMDDLIDKESYRKEYELLQAKLSELKSAADAPHRDLTDLKQILSQDYEAIYNTFSTAEKNTFWKSFIQSILVHEDGSMDISFL